MAAGIAALGVHVLLLAAVGGQWPKPRLDNGSLAVLLIRPSDASGQAGAMATGNAPEKKQPHAVRRSPVRHAAGRHRPVHAHAGRGSAQGSARMASHKRERPNRLALNRVPSSSNPAAPARADGRANRTAPGRTARQPSPVRGAGLPSSARRALLAHIVYPRLARRLGWEGKGLFRLDVHRRHIVRVAPLASTGYRVLDRAVLEGLRDVARLDVADGWYRLPVEFRLQ